MSEFSNYGLGLTISEPTHVSGVFTPRVFARYNLGDEVSSYTQKKSALNGYDNMSVTFSIDLNDADWLFSFGLGLHVDVFGPGGSSAWQGFVNEVDVQAGILSARRGPLLDVTNRLLVVYTRIFTDSDPPEVGGKWETTIVEDDDSQIKYGVLASVESIGQATLNEAEQLRDSYLEENKQEQSSQSLNIGGASSVAIVTLQCLGYIHRAKKYIFENNTDLTLQISDKDGTGKMQVVIGADPSGILSTDYSTQDDNSFLVPGFEQEDRTAYDILKGLVAIGDVNDARYTLGVYDDQKVIYAIAPTEFEYFTKVMSNDQQIRVSSGAEMEVWPWEVMPARWLLLEDFLTGASSSTTPSRDNPAALFIEDVTFSIPTGLVINGQKISTLEQKLAKRGVGGLV